MILQALAAHYDALAAQGRIAPDGWAPAKISLALYLNPAGELTQAVSLKNPQTRGKKTVFVPQIFQLPAPVTRTSGVAANFLWDNASYLLGFDGKGNPRRSLDCFACAKQLHEELLGRADSPAARALLAYFQRWDPEAGRAHPALSDYMEDILAGANLIFRLEDGGYLHDDPAVRRAWQEHYDRAGDGPRMVCLVTGEMAPAESTHPSIKGVSGAQATGAALVSFNAPAFCSYGKQQSLNAPTGKRAAFAYTAALNHLLADRDRVCCVGDSTILCWARTAEVSYADYFSAVLLGGPVSYTEHDFDMTLRALCDGRSVVFNETRLDPATDFYVLGLSPNAGRLSVRFFLHNSFGSLLRNVLAHHERARIVRPAYDQRETLSVRDLLSETINPNAREKESLPRLTSDLVWAILTGARYPATLLNGAVLRMRADHQVTRGRAAILKAYYLKHPHPDVPKEVLTVSLNHDSDNVPFVLGRLFSVLEAIQSAANPGLNTTIRDKYFNSASATPAFVFPLLINLAQKHLVKLDTGLRIHYEKQLTTLASQIRGAYPTRLNLPQQGSFQLGYYHQTQERYQSQKEKSQEEQSNE